MCLIDDREIYLEVDEMKEAYRSIIEETKKSVFGSDSSWKEGKIIGKVSINEETEVRLIRKGVAR